MSQYYSVDCTKWAEEAKKEVRFQGKGKLVKLSPCSGQVLGAVKMPNGEIENPDWHFHVVIEFGGKYFDEANPDGLLIENFAERFDHWDEIKCESD